MQSLRNLALAGAAALALMSAAARGADLPVPPPMFAAPVIQDYGAWYLRGDIGITNQHLGKLASPAPGFDTTTTLVQGFDSSGLFGVGVGYQFNSWFRADVTGEYRSGARFSALDNFPCTPAVGPPASCSTGFETDRFEGTKSEWLFLMNAYLDLGTWHSVTPFVGAGVGFDRMTFGNFTDTNINAPGGAIGYSTDNSKWNFAWALHAGLAYQVTPNFIVELAYRYVYLGNGSTKDLLGYDGTNATFNPIEFKRVDSQDIKLGVRWMFADTFFPQPPLVRKY
jgi:opacity protein-like surface antigen